MVHTGKNMPKITQNKIIWDEDDWMGGLAHQYNMAGTRSNNTFQSVSNFNPYREIGYAQTGFNPANVTNVSSVTSAILNAAVHNTDVYLISSGALVHELNPVTDTISTTAPFPHTITHGAHSGIFGNDITLYTSNLGGTSAIRGFYSFYDTTDWDVGIITFGAPDTLTDNFMSVTPATPLAAPYLAGGASVSHPMIVGDDDLLYIGDRNFLHGYDGATGANGTFYANVLQLPSNYIITSFAKIQNYLVVFAYRQSASAGTSFYKGESKAFFWDYLSLDPIKIVDLNDNYVNGGFEYKGTIGCFTSGRPTYPDYSQSSRLVLYNGSTFDTVCSFSDSIPIGRGGVDINGDMICWNSAGKVYSYGAPFKNMNKVMNILNSGSGSTSGMLKTLTSIGQYISSGSTTSGGLQNLSSNYSTGSIITNLAEPHFPQFRKGKVSKVKLIFRGNASGGLSLLVSLNSRNLNSSTIVSALTSISSGNNIIEYNLDESGNPFLTFDALKLSLTWQTGASSADEPRVSRVEVDYETIVI